MKPAWMSPSAGWRTYHRPIQTGAIKRNASPMRTSQIRSSQRGAVTLLIVALLGLLWPPAVSAQGTIIPFVTQAFYDANGDPCSGCKLTTYAAGTTTPLATYTVVTLTPGMENANPVVMNAAGRPTTGYIFLSATSYKFVLTSSADVAIWTVDNATAIPTTSSALDATGTAGEALSAGDVAYLSDGSGSLTAGRWYKADADTTYSSSIAVMVGIVPTAIASGSTGSIRIGGRTTGLSALTAGELYYVSGTAGALTATPPTNQWLVGKADSTTSLIIGQNQGGVRLPDTAGDHNLVFKSAENSTAERVLSWVPSDGDRTITLKGNPTLGTNDTSPTGTPTFNYTLPCQGRLTATTAVPVTTGDVSAATSIFYAPAVGNQCWVNDGAGSWVLRTFGQLTISLAGCTASRPYDVFVYDNAGVLAAEILIWTSTSARATAVIQHNGVYVKSGTVTRRLVGSFFCNASGGQTDDTFAKRYIDNIDNSVRRVLRRLETTVSWTYSTDTYRQALASTANQVEVMRSVAGRPIEVQLTAYAANTNNNVAILVGIGADSTTVPATSSAVGTAMGLANIARPGFAKHMEYPAAGYHFYTGLEKSEANPTTTFYGETGTANGNWTLMGTTEQ